ncbi:MAG: hypothetical protein KJP00_07310 [Bacteroidia bacterium]|nr:hypothetical protein [Bacteroidia bacterium]
MITQLYSVVDENLDREEVEQILLTLEDDLTRFQAAKEDWRYLKNQLTFIDKINPFGERDRKGEILRAKYDMEDIARLYNEDMSIVREKAAEAIKSVDAFVASFQMDWLMRSIENISVKYYGRTNNRGFKNSGIRLVGKDDALRKAEQLNQTLLKAYGELYRQCPGYPTFIKGYMNYLTEPYHLPLQL